MDRDRDRGDYVGEGRDYTSYDPMFRRHYRTNYATSGYPYERYEPGYRYGYDLANDQSYRNREWNEIEPEARRRWEERREGPWEEFKDTVREGWNQVRQALS